tara:strand:+ start:205 stop:606 length:402 start_codon:yes stop_codon:yes gene_type:complete
MKNHDFQDFIFYILKTHKFKTQQELSDLLEVDKRDLSAWIGKKKLPTRHQIEVIISRLNLNDTDTKYMHQCLVKTALDKTLPGNEYIVMPKELWQTKTNHITTLIVNMVSEKNDLSKSEEDILTMAIQGICKP